MLFLLCGAGVLLAGQVQNVYLQWQNRQQTVERVRMFGWQHQDYISYRQKLQTQLAECEERLQKGLAADDIIWELERQARQQKVRLDNLERKEGDGRRAVQGLQCFSLQFTAVGSCQNVLEFLKNLETVFGSAYLDNVHFSAAPSDDIVAQCCLYVYSR